MTACAMSDGSPITPELDARMLAEVREWRRRYPIASMHGITGDELDMLLRAVDERDALKAALCSEWEADIPAEIRARAVQPEAMPVRAGSTALGIPYAEPMRDEATEIDAAIESDERIQAWHEIAAHPFFASCYDAETSLIAAMLAKLNAAEMRETHTLATDARISTVCTLCGFPVHSIASSWLGGMRRVLFWEHDAEAKGARFGHRAEAPGPVSIATNAEPDA